MPSLADIRNEIEHGLPNERDRLDAARVNQKFYDGDFDEFTTTFQVKKENVRTSLVMQRVVNVLTAHLYKDGPTRRLPGFDGPSAWLESVYKANAVNAAWQEADRLSTVNRVAAFQAVGTADPLRPVRLHVWGGHEFAVWEDPDDPLAVVAVATFDMYDEQRRLRLWDAETVTTYLTAKFGGRTAGGTCYREVDRKPHGYGCLPFSFAHFNMPVRYFWTQSPGRQLRQMNDTVNYRLSQLGDHLVHTRPVGVVRGVRSDWNFPRDRQAGTFITLPALVDAAENATDGKAEYIVCDQSFATIEWQDLQQYIDHTLEMCGIPPSAIRMEQSGVASGVALVAEQIPMVLYAKARQKPYAHYEAALARLVLRVGSRHLLNNKLDRLDNLFTAELAAAAEVAELTLRWPEMMVELPGPDRDAGGTWLLDNGLTSRIELLMERNGLTRDEAELHLAQIAEDRELEAELLGDGGSDFDDEDEDEAEPLDEEDTDDDPADHDDDVPADDDTDESEETAI